MTTAFQPSPTSPVPSRPKGVETVADLIEHLGGIPAHRIRMNPPPGTATERDVVDIDGREGRLFELVDGALVEKGMGARESLLAAFLIEVIGAFVRRHRLGLVLGPDGMLRLMPALVRLPDVSYISWSRIADGRVPSDAIWALSPDLVVEVLSESNTLAEMERKRGEYFRAGTQLIWQVDPERRTVDAFSEPDGETRFAETATIDAGDVLPGFSLSLSELFAVLDQQAPPQS